MNPAVQRVAGRALVLDPDGRALLIRGIDPDDPEEVAFWFTPGGGLDPGETAAAGTMRELHEELGLRIDSVGPVVMQRRARFRFAGEVVVQTEVVHLVEVAEAFTPVPVALDALEQRMILEFRWLSAAEVRALPDVAYPSALASLIDQVVAFGAPDPPWIEDLIGEE